MTTESHQMIEHNNREKANKFAEYITSKALRKYLAEKVKKYAGDNVSVFDGASGSGQLEQFINAKKITAVEIQKESAEALKQNFPTADVFNQSLFQYQDNSVSDCVVMNPPFSLKFKELPQEDQMQIMLEFPWKKSGVIDDIFVLKGLNNANRWGFFILFPGLAYRQTEKMFRSLITPNLVEFNRVKNAFDDTPIDVIFLVIDKEKKGGKTQRELIDCKSGKAEIICQDETELNADSWESITEPLPPQEKIDPIGLEHDCRARAKKNILNEIKISKMVALTFEPMLAQTFNQFLDDVCKEIQKEAI